MMKNPIKTVGYVGRGAIALTFLLPISAPAATTSASVSAEVTGSLSVSTTAGLSFGQFSAGLTPGAVTIDTSGVRRIVGGVSLGSGGVSSAASFQLVGLPNASFAITTPVSVTLISDSGDTMLVNSFTTNPSLIGSLNASGSQILTLGGTLHVAANQIYGRYSGILNLSIAYN